MEFKELNKETRKAMVEELNMDYKKGLLYISKRFNEKGEDGWYSLLKEAIESYDDSWLKKEIKDRNFLKDSAPKGSEITISEGEFGRYYVRGVCKIAIDKGCKVKVYRAKKVLEERDESKNLVGKIMDPAEILEDLRKHIGTRPRLGIPGGPNSGILVETWCE